MKETTKRHISSWVLLAVFLPMLVLSSIHVHPADHSVAHSCKECVHHLPHSGHISSQTTCLFDCVLCQFISLPFLVASAIIFIAKVFVYTASHNTENQSIVSRQRSNFCLRGPPALWVREQ
ncbi:MAG: hypothetical protein IJ693_03935 [Bacteroidaceae bacterium]|nr:hypothetical protein [Bacteroidaceae bacterium]